MTKLSAGGPVGRWLRAVPRAALVRTAVVLFLIVPALISAVFMWTMWDPTVYLKQVPVAVSNDDQGAVVDGKTQNLGTEILDGVTAGGDLQYHRVNSAEALAGVRENRYAFSIVIPRDFTRDISSVTDARPTKAHIVVWCNDLNGTLTPSVVQGVLADAQRQITATIGKEYANQVLVGINTLGSGLGDAAQGAGQVTDGARQLDSGAGQLASGLDDAASGAAQLNTGAGQLHTGAAQLADGAQQLVGGTDQLGDGAVQIRDGIDSVITPALDALTPAQRLAQDLQPFLDQWRTGGDPALADAATQLTSLLAETRSDNPDGLVGQLTQLRDGTRELARQLTDPAADYRSGVLQLADGARQLRDGAGQLSTGVGQLDQGLIQLRDGGHQLQQGTTQLAGGTDQLDAGLRDGAAQAPHISDVDASAGMFSEPLDLDVHNQHPSQVVVNGDPTHKDLADGSGPALVLLASFLAALVIWMLLGAVRAGRLANVTVAAAARSVAGRAAIGALLGAVAAAAAAAFGSSVGWAPQNWPVMSLVVVLVGITAAVTMQTFVVVLGRVAGSITAVCWYMIQIFVFGGIFPPGTTPTPFRPFKDLAPMTFGFRAVVRGDMALYDTMFWVSITMLVAMSVVAVAISIAAVYLRGRRAEPAPALALAAT
ncbi:YhgE/Pip domain-containing protein [Nocardia stercoris]|uniref:YhgE/Pip domain-containing protein n=1 Tax=Nocardia stercoris TaxID=2483361 RepID=A0A3M2L1R7_9NOCA|nr:YhgE/Pip domain-containing protein [Nocardia stercoris]RMI30886.1 YhgE/Pip domain-containing protein [Nocardia stercoris]